MSSKSEIVKKTVGSTISLFQVSLIAWGAANYVFEADTCKQLCTDLTNPSNSSTSGTKSTYNGNVSPGSFKVVQTEPYNGESHCGSSFLGSIGCDINLQFRKNIIEEENSTTARVVDQATSKTEKANRPNMFYNLTGVYISELSLVSPLVNMTQSSKNRADDFKQSNLSLSKRTLDVLSLFCSSLCSLEKPLLLLVAASTCGGSLIADSFMNGSFLDNSHRLSPPTWRLPSSVR